MLRAAHGPASIAPPPAHSMRPAIKAYDAPEPGLVTAHEVDARDRRAHVGREAGHAGVVLGDEQHVLLAVPRRPLDPCLVHPAGGFRPERGSAANRLQGASISIAGWSIDRSAAVPRRAVDEVGLGVNGPTGRPNLIATSTRRWPNVCTR